MLVKVAGTISVHEITIIPRKHLIVVYFISFLFSFPNVGKSSFLNKVIIHCFLSYFSCHAFVGIGLQPQMNDYMVVICFNIIR